jgi:tetratricopeptide (TPR) repeat protein
MNAVIVLFMLLTMGLTVVAGAANDDVKYRILLRQAMLDIDRMDYDKAITKLLEVRANTPENANVNHMLGVCYLYGESDAEKSVFYFNRAVAHASADYEEWDLDETKAPIETAYHLAKAYEQLQDYAQAAEYYSAFLAFLGADSYALSNRIKALIGSSAERCRLAALEIVGTEDLENIVLNK